MARKHRDRCNRRPERRASGDAELPGCIFCTEASGDAEPTLVQKDGGRFLLTEMGAGRRVNGLLPTENCHDPFPERLGDHWCGENNSPLGRRRP